MSAISHLIGAMVFLIIWNAAITGITLKTIFFDDLAQGLGLLFYVTLSWFGIVSAFLVMRRFGLLFIMPSSLGG